MDTFISVAVFELDQISRFREIYELDLAFPFADEDSFNYLRILPFPLELEPILPTLLHKLASAMSHPTPKIALIRPRHLTFSELLQKTIAIRQAIS